MVPKMKLAKKRIRSILLVLTLLICIVSNGRTSDAANFNDINNPSVFIKQATNYTCTLASAVMMIRRAAMATGNTNWASITESSARSSAWKEGSGLWYSFSYAGISVKHANLNNSTSNVINLLAAHPEGIVIYNTSKPHAILLTDYTDGVFYCADPAKSASRIPISSASISLASCSEYWYVNSPSVKLDPIDTQAPVISNLQVTNLTSEGFRVQCNVSDNIGVTEVSMPVWSDYNFQDDLVWHKVEKSGNTYYCDVNISQHNSERGKYIINVNAFDAARNKAYAEKSVEVAPPDTTKPVISNLQVTNLTTEGFRVQCTVTDNVGLTEVSMPVWTESNYQDDLVWHKVEQSGTTFYCDVNISQHKSERGKYIINVNAFDAARNKGYAETSVVVPEPTPLYYLDLNGFLDKIDYALLNADETGNDLGTFGTADIYINGVKVADDVNDYWEAYPVGTKYEIKDIKAKGNTHYSKVLKGSLSGTIQAKRCNVWLYFESNKKQKVQNKITAKDITITAKTKAQTVNLNASALGGAKLSYSGKKAKVNSKGVVTVPAKYVGCLIIKVTSAATSDYLQTTKDVRIYVQPLAPTLKKVTSKYKKTIYVNWSTVKICDGYEVWYSTRQDMKNAKCVNVKGSNKKSVEFKKASGKTYYIRVRAYKKVNGNKNYSAYSNRKKVKVK